jgi:hypothetical protein
MGFTPTGDAAMRCPPLYHADTACTDAPPVDPLIGGTLALLTFYARSPNLAAADKIARNLALLARHPKISEPLQSICTRLFLDWMGPVQTQDCAPDQQWREVLDMPASMQ